jgi:tetrahydromethanopterin S-methyltransferase subunit G
MNVTTPEKKWTDHRLDDLAKKVDAGATQVDKPLGEFRGEVNARFDKVDKRFDKVDERFEKVDERFEKVEGKIDSGIKELRGETNARFDKVEANFKALDAKFDKKFDWLIGILLLSVLGILAAVIGPNVL